MVKLRKKLLVSMMAALLAFGVVACNDDDPADPADDPADTAPADDPADDPLDTGDDDGLLDS